MKSRVWYTATQPILFPPLHLAQRATKVDHFVIMEEAQFSRAMQSNRIALVGKDGGFTITAPYRKHSNRVAFGDIVLGDLKGFKIKLRKALDMLYAKASHYEEYRDMVFAHIDGFEEGMSSVEACEYAYRFLKDLLGLGYTIERSRDLLEERPESPTEWLAELGVRLKATDYVQGMSTIEAYFREGVFKERGIRVWGQVYKIPDYGQLAKEFEPYVSYLDPLFLCGRDALIDVMEGVEVGDTKTMKRWE